MPTSFQVKADPLARPALKLPKFPLMAGGLTIPATALTGVSLTLSGLISLPKLGTVAPPEASAVTVAEKASPARTNLAASAARLAQAKVGAGEVATAQRPAVLPAGFISESTRLWGLTTNWPLVPFCVLARELRMNNATKPTSA